MTDAMNSTKHVEKKKSKKRKREEKEDENVQEKSSADQSKVQKAESVQSQRWMTRDEIYQLIEKMKTTVETSVAKMKYDKGLAEVNWQEVKVGDYTADECRESMKRLISKLRKFRSLEEILDDADRQLKADKHMSAVATPEAERKYKSEFGNKPPKGTTASRLYIDKMVGQDLKANPNASKLALKKKYVYTWHNDLSDKKKVKYIKKALIAKDKYEVTLKKYREIHPDYKPNTPPFISKSDQKLLDQVQGVPEPPPRSGYLYFCQLVGSRLDKENAKLSFLERANVIGTEWKDLTMEKRTEYNKKMEQENEQYRAKMEEFLSKLTAEERSRFEANHLKMSRKTAKQAATPSFVTAVELYQVTKKAKFEAKYPAKSEEELMALMKQAYDALPEKKKTKYEEQEKKLQDLASLKATSSPVKKSAVTNRTTIKSKSGKESKTKAITTEANNNAKAKDGSSSSSSEGSCDSIPTNGKKSAGKSTFTAIKSPPVSSSNPVEKKVKQSSSSSSSESSDDRSSSSSSSSSDDEQATSKSPVHKVTNSNNTNDRKSSSSSSSSSDSSGSVKHQTTKKSSVHKVTNSNSTNDRKSSCSSSSSSDSSDSSGSVKHKKSSKVNQKTTTTGTMEKPVITASFSSASSSESSESSSDDEVPTKKRKIEKVEKTLEMSASSDSSSSSDEEKPQTPKKELHFKEKLPGTPTRKRLDGVAKTSAASNVKPVAGSPKTPTLSSPPKTPKSSKKTLASKNKSESSPKKPLAKKKKHSEVETTPATKVKAGAVHRKTPVSKKAVSSSSDSDSD